MSTQPALSDPALKAPQVEKRIITTGKTVYLKYIGNLCPLYNNW